MLKVKTVSSRGKVTRIGIGVIFQGDCGYYDDCSAGNEEDIGERIC